MQISGGKRRLIILAVCALIVIVFIGIKYGWRLFGYRFCDDPETVNLYAVVYDDHVKIQYISDDSFGITRMEGYVYHVKNKTLYLGIKTLPIIAKGYGEFYISTLDTQFDTRRMEKVVLCGGGKEKVIYNVNSVTE